MQSGDRLDVEIILKEKKTVEILNFVSLARTAAKWNCDMVQVVPLCGKRRRGSSLSLCDKHDMFRDLQADNAIDFADFTDLRPNPKYNTVYTRRAICYSFCTFNWQFTCQNPCQCDQMFNFNSYTNKQRKNPTQNILRQTKCSLLLLPANAFFSLPPPRSTLHASPVSHRWYSYYCT